MEIITYARINSKFSEKKTNLSPELEAIDPAEFFRGSCRTSKERQKSAEQSGNMTKKTNLPERNVQVTISSQTSLRKSKQETAPESKNERETVSLNDENCKSSQPLVRPVKTRKSPKIAASASVKSVTVKKDVDVLKVEEGQMQGTKKQKGEHETKKKFEIRNESTNKTMVNDITRGKKVSGSRMVHQKSSKMTKTLEMQMSKLDELAEIGSPAQEVSLLLKFSRSSICHQRICFDSNKIC